MVDGGGLEKLIGYLPNSRISLQSPHVTPDRARPRVRPVVSCLVLFRPDRYTSGDTSKLESFRPVFKTTTGVENSGPSNERNGITLSNMSDARHPAPRCDMSEEMNAIVNCGQQKVGRNEEQ